jgi:predicted extracellular nuclease
MKKGPVASAFCLVLAVALSCGDDEQGPSGPGSGPEASTLTAASGATNAVNLAWTSCGSSDFAEYRVYRSLTAGIQSNPGAATAVQVVSGVTDTTFTDSGLAWSTTYYYAVQTLDTENLFAWSNEASAATPDSGSGGALTCYEVQGQQASSPYLGQTVSVTGIVTVGEGEYYGTYAAMADEGGGPWSGLILYGNDVTGIQRGDSITITGQVDEYNGLTELKFPTSIVVHSHDHGLPDPEVLTTDEIYQPSAAEQWEGVLVRVEDVTVTSAPDQYGQWKVDDGSGDAMVDDLGDYTYNPVVGDTLEYVIGVLNYSFDEYKMEPRDNDDIGGGGGGGGTVLTCWDVQGQQASSPYLGQTVSVTGIVTAGEGEYYGTYAAMADAGGGEWSGLVLYGNDVTGIVRGDSITITGLVDEYYGLTELKFPTSIVVHSSGHPLPDAEVLSTGEIYQAATAEKWEGVLVMVEDVTVTAEPNEFGEWKIDDGSGDAVVDDLGDYGYVPTLNDQLASVTGVLNYSFDEYKMEPRDDADIVE